MLCYCILIEYIDHKFSYKIQNESDVLSVVCKITVGKCREKSVKKEKLLMFQWH